MLATDPHFKSREFLTLIENYGLVGTWGWTFATDGHVWSRGFFGLLGLVAGDLEPSYRTFLDFVHPEDRHRLETEAQVLSGQVQDTQTFRLIRPNGSLRTVMSRTKLRVTASGRPQSITIVLIDLSNREVLKRALTDTENRRRLVFDAYRILQFSLFRHGEHKEPREMSELTGIPTDVLQDDPFVGCVDDEREHWRREAMQKMHDGASHSGTPLLRLADATQLRFHVLLVPVQNADGDVDEWGGIQYPLGLPGLRPTGSLLQGLEQIVEGRHLRAARALLDWSMTDLATASGLSLSSIRRLEEGGEAPGARSRHRAISALRAAGILFTLGHDGAIAIAAV